MLKTNLVVEFLISQSTLSMGSNYTVDILEILPLSRRKLSLFFIPPLMEWVVQWKTLLRLWRTECKRPDFVLVPPLLLLLLVYR